MKTLLQHISYIRGISFLLISAISAQFASLDRLKSNIEWYFRQVFYRPKTIIP